MLLFVSMKGERLANWTTVVSKVFLLLSLLSTYPFRAEPGSCSVLRWKARPAPHWSREM